MTSLVRAIGLAGVVLLSAGVGRADAQIVDTIEFTTTFPFTVGYAAVPAGSYTIRPDDDNPSILFLSGPGASVLFQAEFLQARETPSKTEIVFKRYGEGYVLKDIWLEGSNSGSQAMVVEGERHAAKHPGPAGEHRIAAVKKPDESKNR